MSENRCALARRNAGLSVGQAARLLGVHPDVIDQVEAADVDDIHEELITFAGCMAELYHVSLKWMLGEIDRFDYQAVRKIAGAENLSFHDRDQIAELIASLPSKEPA